VAGEAPGPEGEGDCRAGSDMGVHAT
jgi:hypothetical protein